MSPRASSSPSISDTIAYLPVAGSVMSPMAMPDTAVLIGTPASMRAREPAHTVAIEEEPLDERMSDSIRMV